MEKDWKNLCKNHSDTFDEWFDSDKFDWRDSRFLAMHCSNHFDKWWDKDKFNWVSADYLIIYCPEHFNIWYPNCPNKDKLDLSPIEMAKLRIANLI